MGRLRTGPRPCGLPRPRQAAAGRGFLVEGIERSGVIRVIGRDFRGDRIGEGDLALRIGPTTASAIVRALPRLPALAEMDEPVRRSPSTLRARTVM